MKRFLAMVAAVAALFAASCSGSQTASDAALNIYGLIAQGNYEAAVEEFQLDTPDTKSAEETKAMLTSLFQEKLGPQLESKGGITSYEAVKEELAEDGKSAKVTVKLTYGNGETEESDVDMVLTENGWKASIKK